MSTTARAQKAPDTRGPVRKLLTSFGFQILAALVLGIAAGLIGRQLGATAENPTGLSATLDTIGNSYVTLLRAAVVPLIFTATGLAWSDRDPGNVVATVAASGPDPTAAGFSFPMEFSPEGGGWQLSRRTADMLLVFGDSAATPTTPPR